MGDANDVRGRILALIAQAEGPLTADSLGKALADVAFAEVLTTLEALVDEGVLSMDLFGFALVDAADEKPRRGTRGATGTNLPKVVVRSREPDPSPTTSAASACGCRCVRAAVPRSAYSMAEGACPTGMTPRPTCSRCTCASERARPRRATTPDARDRRWAIPAATAPTGGAAPP